MLSNPKVSQAPSQPLFDLSMQIGHLVYAKSEWRGNVRKDTETYSPFNLTLPRPQIGAQDYSADCPICGKSLRLRARSRTHEHILRVWYCLFGLGCFLLAYLVWTGRMKGFGIDGLIEAILGVLPVFGGIALLGVGLNPIAKLSVSLLTRDENKTHKILSIEEIRLSLKAPN